MGKDYNWDRLYQKRVANTCIGSSTLRNQGAEGIIDKARKFLRELDLNQFSKIKTKTEFNKRLDKITNGLKMKFPRNARNWGAARKSINIFLLEATLNIKLTKRYKLNGILKFLEVPLDSNVYKGLKEEFKKEKIKTDLKKLPKWKSIKTLTNEDSKDIQKFALKVAKKKKCPRAYLDLIYWER